MIVPKPKKEKRKRHRMTIAVDISQKVKDRVKERDGGRCVICGNPGLPNMHYIPRSEGGLGIEENVACGCPKCHHEYDNGGKRDEHGAKIEAHLRRHYPNWDRSKLYFNKWKEIDPAYRFDNSV
jgi:5-methylcytosine-specific restriction endonuclease McrA